MTFELWLTFNCGWFLNYGWLFNYGWHTHKYTHTHINTVTRSCLEGHADWKQWMFSGDFSKSSFPALRLIWDNYSTNTVNKLIFELLPFQRRPDGSKLILQSFSGLNLCFLFLLIHTDNHCTATFRRSSLAKRRSTNPIIL